MKNQTWVLYDNLLAEKAAEGVERRVMAYNEDLMCVENRFDTGAVGSLHSHPHTQITYVLDGVFEFEIKGEKKVVKKGDTMLKMDEIIHGCVCLQSGCLLDIFTPMRKEFVE